MVILRCTFRELNVKNRFQKKNGDRKTDHHFFFGDPCPPIVNPIVTSRTVILDMYFLW